MHTRKNINIYWSHLRVRYNMFPKIDYFGFLFQVSLTNLFLLVGFSIYLYFDSFISVVCFLSICLSSMFTQKYCMSFSFHSVRGN